MLQDCMHYTSTVHLTHAAAPVLVWGKSLTAMQCLCHAMDTMTVNYGKVYGDRCNITTLLLAAILQNCWAFKDKRQVQQ